MSPMSEQKVVIKTNEYAGCPPEYDTHKSWKYWHTQFEIYCAERDVAPEKKKMVFLRSIGEETYHILETIVLSDPFESDKSYDELAKMLADRFSPKVHVMAERYRLMNMSQAGGQSLADFLGKIQEKAMLCNFNEVRDVRDLFVTISFLTGIRNDETRKKLMEAQGKQTSTQLLGMAEASETISREMAGMKHQDPSQILFVQEQEIVQGNITSQSPKRAGFGCGEMRHFADDCKNKEKFKPLRSSLNSLEDSEDEVWFIDSDIPDGHCSSADTANVLRIPKVMKIPPESHSASSNTDHETNYDTLTNKPVDSSYDSLCLIGYVNWRDELPLVLDDLPLVSDEYTNEVMVEVNKLPGETYCKSVSQIAAIGPAKESNFQ